MNIPLPDSEITSIIRGMEQNLFGHFTFDRRHLPNAHIIDSPQLLLVDSGFRSDTFNVVSRTNLPLENIQTRIREVIAYFQSRDRNFAWWVGPTARPLDIETHLVSCGFQKMEHEFGMSFPLVNLPPRPKAIDDLEIRRVHSKQELTDFAVTIASNWEPIDGDVLSVCLAIEAVIRPADCPMRLFVGYLNGEPVATSELFLDGEFGGLYSVATKQAFRNRGIGMMMTWEALNEMKQAGMIYATLQASQAGRPVYSKLGFEELCVYAVYRLP